MQKASVGTRHSQLGPIATLLAALTLALSGCLEAPKPPMRVAAAAIVESAPLFLADEYGLLDHRRLRVVETRHAGEARRALGDGAVEAALLPLEEAIKLIASGTHLDVLAATGIGESPFSGGGEGGLYLLVIRSDAAGRHADESRMLRALWFRHADTVTSDPEGVAGVLRDYYRLDDRRFAEEVAVVHFYSETTDGSGFIAATIDQMAVQMAGRMREVGLISRDGPDPRAIGALLSGART